VVQAASVDEFYLDLTGTERLFHHAPLHETATGIREQVLERTGISVSIGGGTNRLVAKLATRPAKPGGVFIVPPGEEEAFVGGLDLADLPGVGPALLTSLRERGIQTIADARGVGTEWLERWLGPSRAAWLDRRMRGQDDSEVVPGEGRKSISAERTFARDIDDDEELRRRLLALTVSVTGTLRDQGLLARTVTIKLRDRDFSTRQRSHTFAEPVESDRVVFPVARALLEDLRRRRRTPARLIGIGVSNLLEGPAPRQMTLFESPEPRETEDDRALNQAVDRLRGRFGRDAVVPGGMVDAPREAARDGRDHDTS
jgi:DNA polymerase-4